MKLTSLPRKIGQAVIIRDLCHTETLIVQPATPYEASGTHVSLNTPYIRCFYNRKEAGNGFQWMDVLAIKVF